MLCTYIYMYKLFPNLATFQFHWNFLIVLSRSYVVVYTLASRNPPCIMLHATQITWRLGRYWAHFMHFMGHFMHAGGVPEGAWVFNIYAAFTFSWNIHFMHWAYTMQPQWCCGLKENAIQVKYFFFLWIKGDHKFLNNCFPIVWYPNAKRSVDICPLRVASPF